MISGSSVTLFAGVTVLTILVVLFLGFLGTKHDQPYARAPTLLPIPAGRRKATLVLLTRAR
jgi:hypothetical protein